MKRMLIVAAVIAVVGFGTVACKKAGTEAGHDADTTPLLSLVKHLSKHPLRRLSKHLLKYQLKTPLTNLWAVYQE